jgi:anti-sigma factor RsiW
MTLEERVDAYLEGTLSRTEARRLEAELTEPEAGRALAEAVALRELLMGTGSDEVPDGLIERIEASLGVDHHTQLFTAPRDAPRPRRFRAIRGVLSGFAWSYRGPALAAAPASSAGDGFRTLSYTTAPLAALPHPAPKPTPSRPLWKRVLKIGG